VLDEAACDDDSEAALGRDGDDVDMAGWMVCRGIWRRDETLRRIHF
jgi:hypothetical protein